MKRAGPSTLALVGALLFVSAACGGDDSDANDATNDTASEPTTSEPGDAAASANDADTDEPTGSANDAGSDAGDGGSAPSGDGDFPVATARYTAHGPEAENTIGPDCGVGNVQNGGDLFRFTPPADYAWTGSSGGSGRDEIKIIGEDGSTLLFIEAVSPNELNLVADWEVVGPSGTEVTIEGDTIPVMEVVAEGSTAYALVDLPYLEPLPVLPEGAALGTAIVTSSEEGRPTLEEATAILETVRVERCAALTEALVWSAAGGFAPVPHFDPDPLGKTRPDEPQPAVVGLPTLDAYSIDQVAYLIPVEESRSVCAAERVVETYTENPVGYLFGLVPSGTQIDELEALIADC